MKEKSFLNEILSPKLLAIAWGFIIVICVFIGFSMRGKCASQNSGLPYVITSSEYVNGDGYTINDLQNFYNTRWGSVFPHDFNDNLTLAYDYTESIEGWGDYNYTRVIMPTENSSYSIQLSQTYNNFNIFENSAEITFTNFDYVIFSRWRNQYADCNIYRNQTFTVRFFFDGYLPKYVVNEYDFGNVAEYPVIKDGLVNSTVSGEATPPDLTGDNIGNDKPDIDDYLPTIPTMPTLDNSSLEKISESIFNILQWGFNAIKGTLTGLFEYLGDLLSYSFQKVIDNIKNAIKNLYDNFESLFSPLLNGISQLLDSISQKIDYISQPLDSGALQEAFDNTALMNDFDSISQTVDGAFTPFTSTEEPDTFKIPLHTEQIPLINNTMLTSTVQYIDLGVINPVKPYIRGVMWALTTFGMLYTIIDSIPSYLQGNDE